MRQHAIADHRTDTSEEGNGILYVSKPVEAQVLRAFRVGGECGQISMGSKGCPGAKGLDGKVGGHIPLPSLAEDVPTSDLIQGDLPPAGWPTHMHGLALQQRSWPRPQREPKTLASHAGIQTIGAKYMCATQSNGVIINHHLWLAGCTSVMQNG